MHPDTKQLSDHLYCSLMSSTSAPLSLAVCIRRSWASFPLPRLSCRNFISCFSTSEALPGRLGRSRSLTHGRHLCRPCLRMTGTLVAPYRSWPSVPWCRISNSHLMHEKILNFGFCSLFMLVYQSLKFQINRKHGVLDLSDLAWNAPYIPPK